MQGRIWVSSILVAGEFPMWPRGPAAVLHGVSSAESAVEFRHESSVGFSDIRVSSQFGQRVSPAKPRRYLTREKLCTQLPAHFGWRGLSQGIDQAALVVGGSLFLRCLKRRGVAQCRNWVRHQFGPRVLTGSPPRLMCPGGHFSW